MERAVGIADGFARRVRGILQDYFCADDYCLKLIFDLAVQFARLRVRGKGEQENEGDKVAMFHSGVSVSAMNIGGNDYVTNVRCGVMKVIGGE